MVRAAGSRAVRHGEVGKWMKTPEGWVRANLLLRTLTVPPAKGTLRESALMLLMMKLETIEHTKFRALSQIIMDQEKGVEAFEEYMKLAFPYLESIKGRDKQMHIDILKQEISRGPMMVTPMQQPMAKSRLKRRVVNVKRSREGTEGLYKGMGDVLPLQ